MLNKRPAYLIDNIHAILQNIGEKKQDFAIVQRGEGKERDVRMLTNVRLNGNFIVAVVDVKTPSKGLSINSVETAFGHEGHVAKSWTIIYRSEKITPEQDGLLRELNVLRLHPAQVLSSVSHQSIGMSRE